MATYNNPRTTVVHWIPEPGKYWPTTTACRCLDNQMPSWRRPILKRRTER